MTWGDSNNGGTSALSESGYTKIYSNWYAFVAVKADGSITVSLKFKNQVQHLP
jgi:hypothetical protein